MTDEQKLQIGNLVAQGVKMVDAKAKVLGEPAKAPAKTAKK